jgi:hypothetical protein
MKQISTLLFLFITGVLQAQSDTTRPVEPGLETSYENQDLLIIALVGLGILLLLYFFFKRSRRFKK